MSAPEVMDALTALERFVVENDDLLALEEAIGRFNIFDALRIDRVEIRHSNFFAWLLDPAESHGQGDLFLNAILMDLLKQAPSQKRPLSPVDLDGIEISGVEIRREWHNVDLLIVAKQPHFVIAVENKIDAGEHSNQLQRYEGLVRAEFPGVPMMFVFLTPDGDEATDADWVPYSYGDIHRVLSRIKRTASGSLGTDVGIFLDHYLNLIGSRLMDDPKIDELCKRIYTNHRRALDLIYERVESPASGLVGSAARWLAESGGWVVRDTRSRIVHFVPKSWVGSLVQGDGSQSPKCPVEFFMEVHVLGASAHVRCVVGRCTDLEQRRRVLAQITRKDNEFGFSTQRKELTDRWTRVYSNRIMKWEEDEAPDEQLVIQKLSACVNKIAPELSLLPAVVQSLLA